MLVKNVVNGGNKETSSNIKTFEGTSWENCQNVNSACDCWLLHKRDARYISVVVLFLAASN